MSHKMADPTPDRTLGAAFSLFDNNGDGTISSKELRRVIRCCPAGPTKTNCQPFTQYSQRSCPNFESATHRNLGEPVTEEDIAHVVREVDLDGSGTIDYQEFSKALVGEMKDAGFSL